MAGPEIRPLGASSSTEMAELAGEVMRRAATRQEQKSMAGCILAVHDLRVNPAQLRKTFRALRKLGLSDPQAAQVDKLEALLFVPKEPKPKKAKVDEINVRRSARLNIIDSAANAGWISEKPKKAPKRTPA